MEITGREFVNGHEVISVNANMDKDTIRIRELMALRDGDKIELKNGEMFIFNKFKRTKFTATSCNNGKLYDIPEDLFKRIVEKGNKQINQSYKTLRPGDLFCIKGNKMETMLFKFERIEKGKIKAIDPFNQGSWTLDIGLYLGKISEIE